MAAFAVFVWCKETGTDMGPFVPFFQQATMGLRKSFPKDRNYEFWNIMMCHLIHEQHDLPEKDRMLFGTLAYRMITKAAEIIPTDQVRPLWCSSGSHPPA